MAHIWKDVPGYEGRYVVSNRGMIKTLRTPREGGKLMRPGPNSKGYLCVVLYDGSSPKRPKTVLMHHLVMEVFGPPEPQGGLQYFVSHKDGVKYNNSVDNLEWLCKGESQKRFAHTFSGEKNGRCKYPDSLIKEIMIRMKSMEGDRHACTKLGEEYGVNVHYLRDLRNGLFRKDVLDEVERELAEKAAQESDDTTPPEVPA